MRRYIVLLSLVVTTTSCKEAKIKHCEKREVDRVERLINELETSKHKLSPGETRDLYFRKYTCNVNDSTGTGPPVDYKPIFDLALENSKIKVVITARDSIRVHLPGKKKKKKDPCSESVLRKQYSDLLEPFTKKLKPGEKDTLERLVPSKCPDVDHRKLMKDEADSLDCKLTFIGVEEEDGEKKDVFTLSRPRKK